MQMQLLTDVLLKSDKIGSATNSKSSDLNLCAEMNKIIQITKSVCCRCQIYGRGTSSLI